MGKNRLELFSVLYLILPSFLFAFGWLRQPYSSLVCLLLLASLGFFLRDLPQGGPASAKGDRRFYFLLLLIAIVWTGLSGPGGFGNQSYDYIKHNSLLRDLTFDPWPLFYDLINGKGESLGRIYVVYFMHYYLPAGLVGKLFGWTAANYAVFLWTVAGVYLSLLWFCRCVGKRSWGIALAFVFLGGMQVVGVWIVHGTFANFYSHHSHLGWWAENFQYPSIAAQLHFVPQHSIPAG